MTLAFLTGAAASALTVAGLTALAVWVVTVVSGSTDPWAIAPWLVLGLAILAAIGTYVAERLVYRRSVADKRATGEPWAYRE